MYICSALVMLVVVEVVGVAMGKVPGCTKLTNDDRHHTMQKRAQLLLPCTDGQL